VHSRVFKARNSGPSVHSLQNLKVREDCDCIVLDVFVSGRQHALVPLPSRLALGILKRQSKIVAALAALLLHIRYGRGTRGGGEASLKLPDLTSVNFANFGGLNGHNFCRSDCVLRRRLLFGLAIYVQFEEPAGSSLHARSPN